MTAPTHLTVLLLLGSWRWCGTALTAQPQQEHCSLSFSCSTLPLQAWLGWLQQMFSILPCALARAQQALAPPCLVADLLSRKMFFHFWGEERVPPQEQVCFSYFLQGILPVLS